MAHQKLAPFVSLILVAISITPTPAQNWVRQAPYPADVDCLAIFFTSPDVGWISGDDNLLMGTSDGGATWTQANGLERSPQFYEDPIWDVQFIDENHGWAWGNGGWRTTDGGATWTQLPFVDSIYRIHFLNSQTGYLISNLAVYRTEDGGQTTTMVWDWQDFNYVADGTFISTTEGLLAAVVDDVPGIFRTTDAGQSWQRISNQVLGRILYVTPDLVVGTVGSAFYRSHDGGENWTLVQDDNDPGIFNTGMEKITRIDADSIAAIDINARIWISNDGGQSYTMTQDVFGNWGYGWNIQFPTPECGYATGRMGIILKSTDGGQSWTQISNGAATPLRDMVMRESGVGVAVADRGVILRTDDFGQKWTLLPQIDIENIAVDLNTVKALDSDSFVIGGGAYGSGAFYRSDDAGQTWTQGGYAANFIEDLSFISPEVGWACGAYQSGGYHISKTEDGGDTWVTMRAQNSTRVPTMMQVLPSGRGWILQPQSEGVITNDGFDQSFDPIVMPGGDSWQWFEFANDNVGWFGAFHGFVRKSTDGGYTVQEQTLPGFVRSGGASGHRLRDVRVLSSNEAYIATARPGAIDQGVIYQTLDGESWVALNPIIEPNNQFAGSLGRLDVLPSGEIWVTGGNGFIFSSGIPDPPADFVPNAITIMGGTLVSGSVGELAESDNADLSLSRATADIQSRTEFEVKSFSPVASPMSLAVTLESSVFARSQVNQTIELFDYVAGSWEQVDTRAATRFTDSTVTATETDDLSRFVEPGTMCLKARIRYQSTSARQQFSSNTDQFIWTIGQ